MSYKRSFAKNTTTDDRYPSDFYRTITSSGLDSAPSASPLEMPTDNSKLFRPGGAKSVEIRMWGNSSGNTATIGLFSWPVNWRGDPNNTSQVYRSVGNFIFLGSCTFGGKTITPVHPVLGTVPSSGNVTNYEWSAYTSTFTDDNRVTEYPSGAGTSYQKRMIIDVQGEDIIYPYCTGMTTTTQVIIAMRVIE